MCAIKNQIINIFLIYGIHQEHISFNCDIDDAILFSHSVELLILLKSSALS